MTPLATVCVSGHLVSTPLANVPWLVSLTAPATALDGVPLSADGEWLLSQVSNLVSPSQLAYLSVGLARLGYERH